MLKPFTQEQQELEAKVEQLFSAAERCQENGDLQFCRDLVRQIGAAGLLKYTAPSPSVRNLCFLRYLIAQKTALGDLLFAMQGLGSYPISIAGNEEQKKKYLSGVVKGNLVAAFAMTEPDAGSDAGAMSLRAEANGSGYRLNGKKTLISNAGLADFYTVFARTGEGSKGVTAFVLEAGSKGLRIQPQELIGVHPIGQLEFKDCLVDSTQRLGAEGEGLKIAYSTLDVFRSSVGAAAIGMAERAFQEAVQYSRSRKQFGKPLAELQAIQFKIAEMAQLLRASQMLVWDAATKKDEGAARITFESALAKSFATESAQQIIDQSLQIHGGIGLLKGSITERLYRDVRALRIYEGATEVLKTIIAQQILNGEKTAKAPRH
jgi:acyl-CoA dehydrogenase